MPKHPEPLSVSQIRPSCAISVQQKDCARQGEEHPPSSSQTTAVSQPQSYIGDYHTAPSYMKDNDHITHGYRINFDTPRKIIKSLFMWHNESVNIWTHFLPALTIIIVLVYFFVDFESLKQSYNSYSLSVGQSIDHYSHALDNLTLLAEYDKFKEITKHEFEQIKINVLKSYLDFRVGLSETTQEVQDRLVNGVQNFRQSFSQQMWHHLRTFQTLKIEFERILAPMLVNELNDKLNISYLHELRAKISDIKKSIDSDAFKYLQLEHTPNPQEISRWPIVVFLISAAICMLCSTLFHLFYPMSSRSYTIFNRFDYAGINVLIAGSSFPAFYYGMYCNLDVAILYLGLTMMGAVSLFVLCLFQWIHRPQNVKFKAFFFGGFGISLGIPLSHLLINELLFDNYGDPFQFSSSLHFYLLLGFCYLFGLYVYTVRCPQRNNPGKYNLCGHSHQIWHCFVVLGVVFTYLGSIETFNMRKISVCPA